MGFSSEIEKLERRWQDNPLGLTFVPFAEALRKAGEPARALELLEVGLGQHPNYVPAHIVRGRCHLDGQSNDQAELAFLRVTELDPENIIALKSLAELSERVGRIPEAIRRLETLLDVDRNNEDARAHLDRLREQQLAVPVAPAAAGTSEPAPAPLMAEAISEIEVDFAPLELEPEPVSAPDGADLFPQDLSDLQLANDSDTLQTNGDRMEDVLLGSDIGQVESILQPTYENFSPGDDEPVRDFEPEPLLPESSPVAAETFASLLEVVPPALPPFSGVEQELEMDVEPMREPEPSHPVDSEPEPVVVEEPVAELPPEPVAVEEPVAELPPEPVAVVEPVTELPPEPVAVEELVAELPPEPVVVEEPVAALAQEPALEAESYARAPDEPVAELVPEAPPVADFAPPAEVAEFRNEAEFTAVPEPEPEPVYEPVGMADPEPASGGEEPELVVTETMAEIFLRQGHHELARAVYAQLALRDPQNDRVRSALAALQPEPSVVAAPLPEPAPAPKYDAESSGGKSVEQLFGTLLSAPRPSVAATVHPPAFESRRRPLGEPTRPAEEALSLSAVFGDEGAQTAPAGAPVRSSEPSFDEFFAPTTGPAAEVELPRAPTDAAPSQVPEDLEQFNAWLRGLKR